MKPVDITKYASTKQIILEIVQTISHQYGMESGFLIKKNVHGNVQSVITKLIVFSMNQKQTIAQIAVQRWMVIDYGYFGFYRKRTLSS